MDCCKYFKVHTCLLPGGDYDEYDSEEDSLRMSAIKTLDLRCRIDGRPGVERRVVEAAEDDDDDDLDLEDDEEDSYETRKEKMKLREAKIQKLMKKQEMDKAIYKAEKKAKKKERLKSTVTAVNKVRKVKSRLSAREDLPSASDYSDLDSPHEGESYKRPHSVSIQHCFARWRNIECDQQNRQKRNIAIRLVFGKSRIMNFNIL